MGIPSARTGAEPSIEMEMETPKTKKAVTISYGLFLAIASLLDSAPIHSTLCGRRCESTSADHPISSLALYDPNGQPVTCWARRHPDT
jgi:hypothetical protein